MTQPDLASDRVPFATIPDTLAAVQSDAVELGVVPIENSIEGSVSVTLDTLAFEGDLLIQREIDLPVSLNLCARPGTQLGDIRTVSSYPHAIAQCRRWLSANLGAITTGAAGSTAEAAQQVAQSAEPGRAAIANALAAELYGLDILATDVEDHPGNQTRFVVVGRGVPALTGHDRTTIVCFQKQDRPGSLLAILQEFAARAINLTKLESRPTKRGLGDYCFVIDIEGHVADEVVADCLKHLSARTAEVKFLGSYPVAGEEDARTRRDAAGAVWRDATRWVDDIRDQVRAEGPPG